MQSSRSSGRSPPAAAWYREAAPASCSCSAPVEQLTPALEGRNAITASVDSIDGGFGSKNQLQPLEWLLYGLQFERRGDKFADAGADGLDQRVRVAGAVDRYNLCSRRSSLNPDREFQSGLHAFHAHLGSVLTCQRDGASPGSRPTPGIVK